MNETETRWTTYLIIFIALLVLLGATVGVAYVNLGWLGPVIGVTIASVKALLIILFFMHLRHSSKVMWVIAFAGFFWLGILFVLTLSDFLTRIWQPFPQS